MRVFSFEVDRLKCFVVKLHACLLIRVFFELPPHSLSMESQLLWLFVAVLTIQLRGLNMVVQWMQRKSTDKKILFIWQMPGLMPSDYSPLQRWRVRRDDSLHTELLDLPA